MITLTISELITMGLKNMNKNNEKSLVRTSHGTMVLNLKMSKYKPASCYDLLETSAVIAL